MVGIISGAYRTSATNAIICFQVVVTLTLAHVFKRFNGRLWTLAKYTFATLVNTTRRPLRSSRNKNDSVAELRKEMLTYMDLLTLLEQVDSVLKVPNPETVLALLNFTH